MQTAVEEDVDGSPEPDSSLLQPEARLPATTSHVDERSQKAEEEQEDEDEEALPAGYISRRTTDPYMQKKLREIQVQEVDAASGLMVAVDMLRCVQTSRAVLCMHAVMQY